MATEELEHVVQFYEADAPLLDSLTGFIGGGLAAGGAGIVVATPEHREGLEQRLRAAGIDLDAARAAEAYVSLDAADTLASIVVDGVPDEGRFAEVIGRRVAAAARGGRRVRVFGEMVGLLLSRGQAGATIRLEELWNELRRTHAFRLFCAYPLAQLEGSGLAHPTAEVCSLHSRVVSSGSRPADAAARERVGELEVQVEDLRRLHETSVRLTGLLDVESVLREVLRAAMAVQDTGLGLLSLCDGEHPGLRLGVHAGFDDDFLRHVETVSPGDGPWGTAYVERRRVVVEDTELDPIYAPYREAGSRVGVRSCHSTPLISRRGTTIGVLSVLFAEPHRPSDREMRLMDLYARIAADSIESARLHERLQQELEDRRQSLAREHIARAEAESRQPDEGRVPGHRLARAAHAAQRHPRLVAAAPHEQARRGDARPAALETIERNARAQAQLIEDILDVSRIITGKLRLDRGPVDLAAVDRGGARLGAAGAEAQGHPARGRPRPVGAARHRATPSRLQQVVWNLLSNAIKFTPAGGRVERAAGAGGRPGADRGSATPARASPPTSCPTSSTASARPTRPSRAATAGWGWAWPSCATSSSCTGAASQAESAGEGYGSSFIVRLPLRPGRSRAPRPIPPTAERSAALHGVQIAGGGR